MNVLTLPFGSMTGVRGVVVTFAAVGLCALAGACSTTQSQGGGSPLEGGAAEWPPPPVDPPGGEGDPGSDTGAGDGGLTGGGGTSGGDWGSTGGATTGGGYVCEVDPGGATGDSGSSGGSSSAGSGTTSGGSSGTAGTAGGSSGSSSTGGASGTGGGLSCDQIPGVCEPAYNGAAAPCCMDPDCVCATGYCDEPACIADGACDCKCAADPDCGPSECSSPASPAEGSCPADTDDVTLHLSNDDSNSMASPAYARAILRAGGIVPRSTVRVHEFLNYYDLDYDTPGDGPVTVGIQMRRVTPESTDFALLLGAQSKPLAPEDRKPMNVVFSIDTSGSMSGHPIEMARATLLSASKGLVAGDVVSVVTWSDSQSVLLDGHVVEGPGDPMLQQIAAGLEAGGSTDLHAGLVTAYELAEQYDAADRLSRVVLISDGGANTGVTDIQLIAEAADDADGSGIYLVGVGVADPGGYDDTLMDEVTDAGKGAHLFVDSEEEAERWFNDRFAQVMDIAARDVRMELTMPWYFGIREFHGEEYSADPKEVEPQHLSYGDSMNFHQIVGACDAKEILGNDEVRATVRYLDPYTLEEHEVSTAATLEELTKGSSAELLYEADAIVAFAHTLIQVDYLRSNGQSAEALALAQQMAAWLADAKAALADPDIDEIAELSSQLVENLQNAP